MGNCELLNLFFLFCFNFFLYDCQIICIIQLFRLREFNFDLLGRFTHWRHRSRKLNLTWFSQIHRFLEQRLFKLLNFSFFQRISQTSQHWMIFRHFLFRFADWYRLVFLRIVNRFRFFFYQICWQIQFLLFFLIKYRNNITNLTDG